MAKNNKDIHSTPCIFCAIRDGKIESSIVHEPDDFVFAFNSNQPESPVHIIVASNECISSLNDVSDTDYVEGALIMTTRKLAAKLGIAETGYRIVLNTGAHAGQTIQHLHLHLLGGGQLGGIA